MRIYYIFLAHPLQIICTLKVIMKWFLIIIAILVIAGFSIFSWITGTYNSLIRERTDVQTQQAQVETQLQRRFDLVPNLVASVKGALAQEQKVFKDIADARTKYGGTAPGSSERVQAANQYESALGRLLVVMENYPELRSINTVQDLMTQLEGTENRINVARQRYNESVRTYNQHVQTFPTNMIAGMFGFTQQPMFESVQGADRPPEVNLEE